jgi:hypothetical protein
MRNNSFFNNKNINHKFAAIFCFAGIIGCGKSPFHDSRRIDFGVDQGCYSLDDYQQGWGWIQSKTVHKNICIGKTGIWIESDGDELKYGNLIFRNGAYFGCFNIYNLKTTRYDSSDFTYHSMFSKSYSGIDTAVVGLSVDSDDQLILEGNYPKKLNCWEYKLSDSGNTILDSLDIPKVKMCDILK